MEWGDRMCVGIKISLLTAGYIAEQLVMNTASNWKNREYLGRNYVCPELDWVRTSELTLIIVWNLLCGLLITNIQDPGYMTH